MICNLHASGVGNGIFPNGLIERTIPQLIIVIFPKKKMFNIIPQKTCRISISFMKIHHQLYPNIPQRYISILRISHWISYSITHTATPGLALPQLPQLHQLPGPATGFWAFFGETMGLWWEYHGNMMGKSWECDGNMMGKSWDMMGIWWENPWEYDGKIMGIWWGNRGNVMGIWWGNHGNMMGIWWENHGNNDGKTMDYDGHMMGKSWEYDGNMMGKSWEYDGNMMGIWWGYLFGIIYITIGKHRYYI